jgi:hypothetical protein
MILQIENAQKVWNGSRKESFEFKNYNYFQWIWGLEFQIIEAANIRLRSIEKFLNLSFNWLGVSIMTDGGFFAEGLKSMFETHRFNSEVMIWIQQKSRIILVSIALSIARINIISDIYFYISLNWFCRYFDPLPDSFPKISLWRRLHQALPSFSINKMLFSQRRQLNTVFHEFRRELLWWRDSRSF